MHKEGEGVFDPDLQCRGCAMLYTTYLEMILKNDVDHPTVLADLMCWLLC